MGNVLHKCGVGVIYLFSLVPGGCVHAVCGIPRTYMQDERGTPHFHWYICKSTTRLWKIIDYILFTSNMFNSVNIIENVMFEARILRIIYVMKCVELSNRAETENSDNWTESLVEMLRKWQTNWMSWILKCFRSNLWLKGSVPLPFLSTDIRLVAVSIETRYLPRYQKVICSEMRYPSVSQVHRFDRKSPRNSKEKPFSKFKVEMMESFLWKLTENSRGKLRKFP